MSWKCWSMYRTGRNIVLGSIQRASSCKTESTPGCVEHVVKSCDCLSIGRVQNPTISINLRHFADSSDGWQHILKSSGIVDIESKCIIYGSGIQAHALNFPFGLWIPEPDYDTSPWLCLCLIFWWLLSPTCDLSHVSVVLPSAWWYFPRRLKDWCNWLVDIKLNNCILDGTDPIK